MIVPLFLPHLGCSTRCIYCNQNDITGVPVWRIAATVEDMAATNAGSFEVGLYGGNIFGVRPETLEAIFQSFHGIRDRISSFRVSTKPVPLRDDLIDILKKNGVGTIELGIPSFDDAVLGTLNRGHSVADLERAFHRLTEEGFSVALQVMVGLPGETMDHAIETAGRIVGLLPSYIRIYPLAVIEDTPLHDLYRDGAFVPVDLEEAVSRALVIYLNALAAGVPIVKMGLTDNEIIADKIVAGCHHSSFGFLVKSEAYFRAVEKCLQTSFSKKTDITVRLNDRDIPHLVGHKRKNMERFRGRGHEISWQTADIPEGHFAVAGGLKEVPGNIFDALDTKLHSFI